MHGKETPSVRTVGTPSVPPSFLTLPYLCQSVKEVSVTSLFVDRDVTDRLTWDGRLFPVIFYVRGRSVGIRRGPSTTESRTLHGTLHTETFVSSFGPWTSDCWFPFDPGLRSWLGSSTGSLSPVTPWTSIYYSDSPQGVWYRLQSQSFVRHPVIGAFVNQVECYSCRTFTLSGWSLDVRRTTRETSLVFPWTGVTP